MGLRINQNISAMNAYRNLSVTSGQMEKSLERLSSGYRINRAADDAAGLSISEGLRSQIGGMKVAVPNTHDGVLAAHNAEGGANKEMTKVNAELDRIGNTTAFGKSKLLDGSFGTTVTSKVDATAAA